MPFAEMVTASAAAPSPMPGGISNRDSGLTVTGVEVLVPTRYDGTSRFVWPRADRHLHGLARRARDLDAPGLVRVEPADREGDDAALAVRSRRGAP